MQKLRALLARCPEWSQDTARLALADTLAGRSECARLVSSHGTLDDYDLAVAPLNRAFDARVTALAALSGHLYAAASVIDAARGDAGAGAYVDAARTELLAIDDTLTAIEDGAVLPPVPLPPAVDALRAALRGIVGGAQ